MWERTYRGIVSTNVIHLLLTGFDDPAVGVDPSRGPQSPLAKVHWRKSIDCMALIPEMNRSMGVGSGAAWAAPITCKACVKHGHQFHENFADWVFMLRSIYLLTLRKGCVQRCCMKSVPTISHRIVSILCGPTHTLLVSRKWRLKLERSIEIPLWAIFLTVNRGQ